MAVAQQDTVRYDIVFYYPNSNTCYSNDEYPCKMKAITNMTKQLFSVSGTFNRGISKKKSPKIVFRKIIRKNQTGNSKRRHSKKLGISVYSNLENSLRQSSFLNIDNLQNMETAGLISLSLFMIIHE